jgi:hypothetical protein
MNARFLARNLRLLADTGFNAAHNYCVHVRGSQYGVYDNVQTNGGAQDGILIGVGPFGSPTQGAQLNHFQPLFFVLFNRSAGITSHRWEYTG